MGRLFRAFGLIFRLFFFSVTICSACWLLSTCTSISIAVVFFLRFFPLFFFQPFFFFFSPHLSRTLFTLWPHNLIRRSFSVLIATASMEALTAVQTRPFPGVGCESVLLSRRCLLLDIILRSGLQLASQNSGPPGINDGGQRPHSFPPSADDRGPLRFVSSCVSARSVPFAPL